MCGIAGILTDQADLDLAPLLTAMLRAVRHRGPDDEGCQEVALPGGRRLGFVHSRLAILDLSAAGHQPMTEPASGSWITYNGEVYNHDTVRRQLPPVAYISTGDTETILKGWVERGEEVLPLLRGMFAFALYDARRQRVWLVRDRLGIKPLYVSQTASGTWVFASEVRALLASGLVARRLRAEAIESYLAFGAVADPWTMLDGVESLRPAECWSFDVSPASRRPGPIKTVYWRPVFAARSESERPRAEIVEQLRPVLLEAVGLRMVSDVPVGVFLSGGIDSGAVVAALAARGHRLHTFSVVFAEPHYDESRHSQRVARHYGTHHTELLLRPAQMVEDYERAVDAYDQPSIDGINTYFIARAVRKAGIKVALSGLGGDELFAGYASFRRLARLERELGRPLAWAAYQALRWLAPRSIRTVKLGAILRGEQSRLAHYAVCREVMVPGQRRPLFPRGAPHPAIPLPRVVADALSAEVAELDAVNAHSRLELGLYMANMLLRDLDQMSMAHALEVREPLLDHVLVETVAGLPGPLKLAAGQQGSLKALLLDALPNPLPPEVHRRPKMGFVLPWERWLRQELGPWIGSVLTDRTTLQAAGLDANGVEKLWNGFLASQPGTRYTDVLCLAHLLHWTRRHGLTLEG